MTWKKRGKKGKKSAYCKSHVSTSNWSKHTKTKKHVSLESSTISRAICDTDDSFTLAEPTAIPGPSVPSVDRDDEVLETLIRTTKRTSVAVSKTTTEDKSTSKGKPKSDRTKRDKSSANFLITAHS